MNYGDLMRAAEEAEPDFRRILEQCGPVRPHGILRSEMLMAYAIFRALGLRRVFESGRMWGESTQVLAGFCADECVSVELLAGTDAAAHAEAALAGRDVSLLYGDGSDLIPGSVGPDAMVIIDGPKRAAQVAMAMDCLASGAAAVLCHDAAPQKVSGRAIAQTRLPLLLSSHKPFVDRFGYLDAPCWAVYEGKRGTEFHAPYIWKGRKQRVYGPTLAAIIAADIPPGTLARPLRAARVRIPRPMPPAVAMEPGPVAVVLGGAACVHDDLAAFEALIGRPWDGITVAVNDIGCHLTRPVTAWATLHGTKMARFQEIREGLGLPALGAVTWSTKKAPGIDQTIRPWGAGSGSSGLLGVMVAHELGARRVVLCGVPMDPTMPHFEESTLHPKGKPWQSADSHWRAWRRPETYPRLVPLVRSMSGRTRAEFGAPTPEWLEV